MVLLYAWRVNMSVQIHPIPPVFDENSKILILGSFPSVKSREARFFYGHPQNRFWKTLAAVLNAECPSAVGEKKDFLLSHKIAVWDVIKSCEISGSADSSIRNAEPNDLARIFGAADIKAVFANGGTAYRLYKKYNPAPDALRLPSTSPANAAFSLERLIGEWKIILKYL